MGGNLDQHNYNAAAGGRPKLKDLLLALADGTVDITTMLERGAGAAAAKTANAKTFCTELVAAVNAVGSDLSLREPGARLFRGFFRAKGRRAHAVHRVAD